MPNAWTQWECCTCHKRHCSYDEASACEREHIVKAATDNLTAQLNDIMGKGKCNAARR